WIDSVQISSGAYIGNISIRCIDLQFKINNGLRMFYFSYRCHCQMFVGDVTDTRAFDLHKCHGGCYL
ncbi:Os03g0789800, partial [Oryza sativa Japonica Group]